MKCFYYCNKMNQNNFIVERIRQLSQGSNLFDQHVLRQTLLQTFQANLSDQQNHLSELQHLINQCTIDSRQILSIEQNIKGHVQSGNTANKIFLMLCCIFSGDSDATVRYISGIILKNSIKSFYQNLRDSYEQELKEIEIVCFIMLASEALGYVNLPIKVWYELKMIISELCKHRFNEYAEDLESQGLLQAIIGLYQNSYSLPSLETLSAAVQTIDDDRFGRVVPQLLQISIEYLNTSLQQTESIDQNKLLNFIQLLYKNVEWAIGVDSQVLKSAVKQNETKVIIQLLMTECLTKIKKNADLQQNVLEKFNFQFVEKRRLACKILTMLVRDFSPNMQQPVLLELFKLCMQNLMFFYPTFAYFMNQFNKELFDEGYISQQKSKYFDSSDIDFEEFEQEIKAYVAQLINLLQTVIGMTKDQKKMLLQFVTLTHQNQIQKMSQPDQILALCKIMLKMLLGYCMMSQQEINLIKYDDNETDVDTLNAFLITFMETDEDQFNTVSIRLSIVESLEQLGMHDGSFFSQFGIDSHSNLLLQTVEEMFLSQNQNPPQDKMLSYETINQVDIFRDFTECTSKTQNQEIAMFMLGDFRQTLTVPQQFVAKLLDDFGNLEQLVAMRLLWLLEKYCIMDTYYQGDHQHKVIFERLCDLAMSSLPFPLRYQAIKTIHKFVQRINLREQYAENFAEILKTLISQTASLLQKCNEDTVHIPIQIITYLTKIDENVTQMFISEAPQFMQVLLQLYEKYKHDGLLEDDIVDLIKVQASVQGNEAFKEVFVKQTYDVINLFYNCVTNMGQNAKLQEEAQRIIDSNQLKNMLSIFNSFLLSNNQFVTGQLSSDENLYYAGMFKMICDILFAFKDTYVNLHLCLTLGAFSKTLLKFNKELLAPLRQLLNKLTNSNIGIDDSASLYVGHAIANILNHDIDETNDIQQLLPQCMSRIVKTNMPSTTKSYSIPLCYIFVKREQDLLPQLMVVFAQKESKDKLTNFLDKVCANFVYNMQQLSNAEIVNDSVLKMQSLGLASMLNYSARDNHFAGLKMSKNIPLQNLLVHELTEYLAAGEIKPNSTALDQIESSGPAKKNNNKDPYGGYGEENDEDIGYGDYGDYGMEDGDDFGMMGDFGADFQDMNLDSKTVFNGAKRDEHYLINHLIENIDVLKQLSEALRNVGPQTLKMIVRAGEDTGINEFSPKQRGILDQLFL